MSAQDQVGKKAFRDRDSDTDPTDVPFVTVRELATALKVLSGGVSPLAEPAQWGNHDLERVDHFFWQHCPRDRKRKTAVLVRLRSLIVVSRSRMLKSMLARSGSAAAVCLIETAATMRLNSKIGFSPNKVTRAVAEAILLSAACER